MDRPNVRRRWWVPILLPFMGVGGGVVLGAATNAWNGMISPEYFRWVMGWWTRDVWGRAVVQGMFEGGVLGLLFAVVVSLSFAASTRLYGTLGLAAGALVRAMGVVLLCWVIGGVIGTLVPEVWLIRWTPVEWHARRNYGWVGGSIWGAYGGTLLGAVVACVWLHLRWVRVRWTKWEAGAGFEVLPSPRPSPASAESL